jgi:hypothetical protein
MQDVAPAVYTKYNLKMYLRATQENIPRKYVLYFRKEATKYKEYLSYKQYIFICNPENCIWEWKEKLRYLFYILKRKIKL